MINYEKNRFDDILTGCETRSAKVSSILSYKGKDKSYFANFASHYRAQLRIGNAPKEAGSFSSFLSL